MQLCDAFDLPLVTLCDTPGMMVGPDVEATALVRHCSRLFVTGANVSVPTVTVVLRKAYGLGAQAMMGGSTKAPLACVAWPTASSGAWASRVRCGSATGASSRPSPTLHARSCSPSWSPGLRAGKGVSVACYFEIDDVIDPAETRRWIIALLDAAPAPPPARARTPERRHLVTPAQRPNIVSHCAFESGLKT